MADLLERPRREQVAPLPLSPFREVDEAAARRTLREQIAHLESELVSLFCSAYPRTGFDWSVASRGGPRILGLRELEELRDDLAERLHQTRRQLQERTAVEEQNRVLIERMMLDPESYKWVLVQNEDIGERGCKQYHVRPRWGIAGMLLNWWRVKISSGCPLAA